ncbi:MAG: nucleotide exchange factor GrpE [Pseudomonadota bacterium]
MVDEKDDAADATAEGVEEQNENATAENVDIEEVSEAEEELVELDPMAVLQAEIESLNQQLEDAKDQALRAAAEAQNVRRRAEKDVESAHKFGMEKFCRELLAVVDNLERAQDQVNTEDESLKPLLEGIDLTQKSFIDVLAKFSLERLDPVGEPFDPQLHQAMTMIENPDMEANTVMDVMQKGYTLHGRLLRPAMVVVSK